MGGSDIMTKRNQRQLLRAFTKQVTAHLLAQSARWPKDWDGHELRELTAAAFEHERSRLMRESRRRRLACQNDMIVNRLY
jgi:hypothetical protein